MDYKSQAKSGIFDKQDYLDDRYHDGYKTQMDFYSYLLTGMGFDVHPTSYFLVCNAKTDHDRFHKTINYDEYLVLYEWNSDRIEGQVDSMVALMNQHQIPEPNECCKNSAYSEQYAKAVHLDGNSESKPVQRRLFF